MTEGTPRPVSGQAADPLSKAPGHVEAATVAGMQFILGIGIVLAITLPTVFVVFVLWPMGWKAVVPFIMTVIGFLCLVQVVRVIMRKDPDALPSANEDTPPNVN